MKRSIISLTAVAALVVSQYYAAAVASAGGGGNSAAAHACQKGGYASLLGGTSSMPDTSITFGNAGGCASYAAHGGTLWQPVGTATFRIDATNPEWQDTGIDIPANDAVVISTVNDGGGTCDAGAPGFCITDSLFSCQNICLANANWYSAIGQVDSGTPFDVFVPGLPTNPPVVAAGPGELLLGFNDQKDAASGWLPPKYAYFDNAGYFTATITTYSPVN